MTKRTERVIKAVNEAAKEANNAVQNDTMSRYEAQEHVQDAANNAMNG